MGFLSSISFFMTLCDVFGAAMPHMVFLVARDWDLTFDCYGVQTLLTDLVFTWFKLWVYIAVIGCTKETCIFSFLSIMATYACATLLTSALFSLVSHKSLSGHLPRVLLWGWGLLFVHFLMSAIAFVGLQVQYEFSDVGARRFVVFVKLWEAAQAFTPIGFRICTLRDNRGDTKMEKITKAIQTILEFVTSSYAIWEFSESGPSNLYSSTISKARVEAHKQMSIGTIIVCAIQLTIRAIDEWKKPKEDIIFAGKAISSCFHRLKVYVISGR